MTRRRLRFTSPASVLLPVLAALLFHSPALLCGFVWDDVPVIESNTRLADPGAFTRAFAGDYGDELGSGSAGYYRPLFVSLAVLVYRIFGPSPLAFHAVSLLLFCGVVLLLTLACRRLLGPGGEALAAVAGLIFAAHPARVEVVSLFTSLPDLLVEGLTLIIVLLACSPARQSLALHEGNRTAELNLEGETEASRSASRLAVAAGCLAASLAAGLVKESAFFIVVALAGAAIVVALLQPARRSQCVAAAVGCVAGLSLAGGARVLAGIQSQYPLPAYLSSLFRASSGAALQGMGWAVRDLLLPGYAVFMKEPRLPGSALTQVSLLAVFLVLALSVVVASRKGRVVEAFLVAWIAAGMSGVSLLITANIPYSQRYLPILPGVLLLCLLANRPISARVEASPRFARSLAYVLATYVVLHGAFTLAGSIRCVTPTSFFDYMAEREPALLYPRVALVRLTAVHGIDPHVPAEHLRRAEAISPRSPEVRALGKLMASRLMMEKHYAEALHALDWAQEVLGEEAEIFGLKAAAQAYNGDLHDAARLCDRALALDPTNATYLSLAAEIAADLE